MSSKVNLPPPIDSDCPHQEICNLLRRCFKNTSTENVKKYPPDWGSVGQRVGWSWGIGRDSAPDSMSTPSKGVSGGFTPPQFTPSIFKEGEWIVSGSSVAT